MYHTNFVASYHICRSVFTEYQNSNKLTFVKVCSCILDVSSLHKQLEREQYDATDVKFDNLDRFNSYVQLKKWKRQTWFTHFILALLSNVASVITNAVNNKVWTFWTILAMFISIFYTCKDIPPGIDKMISSSGARF